MLSFDRPVDYRRRPWQRRIEVYSPKLHRRVALFSYAAQQAWLLLEADPAVKRFCERPAFVEGSGSKMLDFWLDRGRRCEFWVLALDSEQREAGKAVAHGLPVRTLRLEDLKSQALRIQNWAKIHPYLVSEGPHLDPRLRPAVLARLTKPHALEAIESAFSPVDATAVRAALFSLVASGKVIAPDLDRTILGPKTVFRQA